MPYVYLDVLGLTRRECLGNGEWGAVDVSACQGEEFIEISMEVPYLYNVSGSVCVPFNCHCICITL